MIVEYPDLIIEWASNEKVPVIDIDIVDPGQLSDQDEHLEGTAIFDNENLA